MVPPKVTKETVWGLCDIMAEQGQEPTLILLRESLGDVGSYSTIKSYLDSWKDRRALNAQANVPMPEQVAQRAVQLGQQLWNMAAADARERIAEVMSASEEQISQAEEALAEAEQEIGRLERLNEEIRRLAEEKIVELDRLRMEMVRAEQAVADMEPLRAELREAQKELRQASRLEGENEALRREIERHQAMVEMLSRREDPPPAAPPAN